VKALAILLAFAAPLFAQLPDAPKPQIDRLQWTLLAADAGIRGLDVYSTHKMLERGCHEKFLPDSISHHPAAMIAFSAAVVGTDWYIARTLTRHHHRRLAHLATIVDIGVDAPWAIHNLYIHGAPQLFLAP
jgi:hypothetical protein